MFSPAVDAAIKAHALAEYPKECCGVVNGAKEAAAYVALQNIAANPEEEFELPRAALIELAPVLAVVHSHCFPKHGASPTSLDMQFQMQVGLPYGIVWTDGKAAGVPVWFGDFLLDVPLFNAAGRHIQREFLHGVTDCYSLIRTWFWQKRGVKLSEFPRDDEWWKAGGDLYRDGIAKSGFHEISANEAKPGDVALMKWGKWPVPFHAGILVEDGLILHHLARRLSRREPFGRWTHYVTHYVRHE